MSKIHILPEHLANQIAAGEVIERPASVVKELIENSLDAGADHIEVDVEKGGTRLIRVVDNGEGMDEDDVLLCFERHGTSKITGDGNLFTLNTLGFRGEAIPSIASVAKMTITSRHTQSELGTTAVSIFGSLKKVHETGSKRGTSIEVADLFGNTPARRKFLRTARTELSHIDDTIKDYALGRPTVSFILRFDGREIVRLEQGMSLSQRLGMLLNYDGEFLTVDSGEVEADGIKISGLLVPPESGAPVAARLRLFVNDRAIRDRLLTHAVAEGLRSFLMKGRQPTGIINVSLPPEAVDVNVHPAKHEVRFKDPQTLRRKTCDAVAHAILCRQQQIRGHLFDSSPHVPVPTAPSEPSRPPKAAPSFARQPIPLWQEAPPIETVSYQLDRAAPLPATEEAETHRPVSTEPRPRHTVDEQTQAPIREDELVVIGTFQNLYIFCRNKDKLIVIDQHAAHERLLFEDLRRQYSTGAVASQQLLFPATIELSVFQSHLVEANLEQLMGMGFSLRDFGGTTWVLEAVPALAGSADPQALFSDILEQFGSERTTQGGDRLDNILATMACKAAVKSGDSLSEPEIRALLKRMIKADQFSHCPHGRPVVKIFHSNDLKKWFFRN